MMLLAPAIKFVSSVPSLSKRARFVQTVGFEMVKPPPARILPSGRRARELIVPLMLGLRLLVKTVSANPSAFRRQMLSILWRDSADPAARILPSGWTASAVTDAAPGLKASGVATFTVNVATRSEERRV